MNRVAIVIPNWNGADELQACLDSLLVQDFEDYLIIVVENGSTDDSIDILKTIAAKNPTKIHIIYNKTNLGFAGGVNTGIRFALDQGFDGVALFNNDATADKKWLPSLVKAAEPKDIGISTGLLLHEDGKTIDSTGDWFSTWGLPFPRNRGDKTAKAPSAELVFGASGGASLYKTALLKDIGLFDEDFFAYYEDADVSFRAQLAGWKVVYTPTAIAYHKQGATSKKIPGFAVYQTFKNLPLLFAKDVPKGLILSVGIRFYLAYILMFLNAIKNGAGLPAVKGLGKSIVLKPSALKKRRLIQKNKRVSSDYIKSILWPDLPPDQTGLRKLRRFFTGKK